MKKLLVLIAVAVVGLVAVNYVTTGEITLKPSFSRSDEEQAVRDLQMDFAEARTQYAQAYRTAAVSGIDTTGDADAAIDSVTRIKRELEALRKGLSEDRAKGQADDLARAVRAFESDLK